MQALEQQPSAASGLAADLATLRKVHSEQSAALQLVTDQLRAAQEHNASLQDELDTLSSNVREASQASDMQHQIREVGMRLPFQ